MVFTYEEVKKILCDACRLGVSETFECDTQTWLHTLNGIRIRCAATDWRRRAQECLPTKDMETHDPSP